MVSQTSLCTQELTNHCAWQVCINADDEPQPYRHTTLVRWVLPLAMATPNQPTPNQAGPAEALSAELVHPPNQLLLQAGRGTKTLAYCLREQRLLL